MIEIDSFLLIVVIMIVVIAVSKISYKLCSWIIEQVSRVYNSMMDYLDKVKEPVRHYHDYIPYYSYKPDNIFMKCLTRDELEEIIEQIIDRKLLEGRIDNTIWKRR